MQGIDNTRAGGALSSLSDVNISSPVVGDLLIYNGSEWINDDFAEGHTILNESGTAVTDEANLQFTNGLKVTDDSTNHITKVEVDTEFEQAYTRTNIESGDTFSTILGKIKKWFTDIPRMFVSKSGDSMEGGLAVYSRSRYNGIVFGGDWEHETTTTQPATILIGNGSPDGTLNCCHGQLRIYGKGAYRTDLEAPDSTAHRTIKFPNADGIVALTTDIPDVSGKVNKSGDTMTGRLIINQQSGNSGLWLGNNIPNGTTGASRGLLLLYGLNQYYGQIFDGNGLTANRDYYLPDKSGTLALTSDVDTKVSKSGDTMTGALTIKDALVVKRNSTTQATFERDNTGTSSLSSIVYLGNDIPNGTTGCSDGALRIYGKGAYYTTFEAPNSTANRKLTAPDASGTLALSGTVPLFSKISGVTGTTKTDKMTNGELVMVFVKVNNNDYFPAWWSHICGCGALLNASYDTDGGNSIEVRVRHSNRQYWIEYAKLNGNDVTSASTLEVHRMTI